MPTKNAAIAAELRQVPKLMNSAPHTWISAATIAGRLLIDAVENGALAGERFSTLRVVMKMAGEGKLAHQLGRPPGSIGPSGAWSPDAEWHAFVNAYAVLLKEVGIDQLSFTDASVRDACVRIADLLDAEVRDTGEQETPAGPMAETCPAKTVSRDDAVDEKILSPSRLKARATYEYAINTIEGADRMSIRDLHQAILDKLDALIAAAPTESMEVGKLQTLRDSLPSNSETFGRYLREAGINRYNSKGDRLERISRFPRKHQV